MKVEAWIFGALVIFLAIVTPVYWFMSHEITGTDQFVIVRVEWAKRFGGQVPFGFSHMAVFVGVEILQERIGELIRRDDVDHRAVIRVLVVSFRAG